MSIKPYYEDLHNTLYCMDFRGNDLPDESIQCVVTSPPYWGLRKYSGEQDLIWGGDKDCQHEWIVKDDNAEGYTGRKRWQHGVSRTTNPEGWSTDIRQHGFCSLCGAWKGQYGLEPTSELYVQHTIEILREIRRVLRKDGVCFWNIGDSYSGYKGAHYGDIKGNLTARTPCSDGERFDIGKPMGVVKPKDLCLIPFRVAIAAQEDGWWVRSDIIWSKPNPMPESVTDRPTNSHEYILMLTKSAKYYWDADAVREDGPTYTRKAGGYSDAGSGIGEGTGGGDGRRGLGFKQKDVTTTGRNIRSVWTFPTQPYPEAHFAVFPEKLPETCIKAATPEVGCCSKCGAPWERVVEKTKIPEGTTRTRYNPKDNAGRLALHRQGVREEGHEDYIPPKTIGWQPTCKCWRYAPDLPIIDGQGFKEPYPKVPSIVLDPFSGAGTTLWVAKKLNRRAKGYDTSEEYCQLTIERIRQQVFDLTDKPHDSKMVEAEFGNWITGQFTRAGSSSAKRLDNHD